MSESFTFKLEDGYRIYSRKKGFTIQHTITTYELFIGVFSSEIWNVELKNNTITIEKK